MLRQSRHGAQRHSIVWPVLWLLACTALPPGCNRSAPVAGPSAADSVAREPTEPNSKPAPDAPPLRTEPAAIAHATPPEPDGLAPTTTPVEPAHPGPAAPMPRIEPRPVDEARLAAAGIRAVHGRHITLYTDLPPAPPIDTLVEQFDAAWPQWQAYFAQVPQREATDRFNGFLMGDKGRFIATGLLPPELPDFPHGFSVDAEMWLFEQPNDYYRLHLLLHEGTHAFMNTHLGHCGPPWYMEGIAELLATHQLVDGLPRLNYFPRSRSEVPDLGRVKLVREAIAQGRLPRLFDVLGQGPTVHRQNEAYAWSWALAALLDGHPRYRERFRSLAAHVNDPEFHRSFLELYADDLPELAAEWLCFASTLQYGYDVPRAAIEFGSGRPLPEQGAKVTIRADRGWQSTGIRLEAGRAYRLQAAGRYQVADEPEIWWSEPGGVSIRYIDGRPLGQLLAAVCPDVDSVHPPRQDDVAFAQAAAQPHAVGLATTFVASESGTLYLRINDSPAELADNAGTLEVAVQVVADP